MHCKCILQNGGHFVQTYVLNMIYDIFTVGHGMDHIYNDFNCWDQVAT